MRAPACSQAALIPMASSPERTETRPSSQAESTTGRRRTRAARRCRSRTTGRRPARPRRTAGSRRCAGRGRRGAARRRSAASSATRAAVASSPQQHPCIGPRRGRSGRPPPRPGPPPVRRRARRGAGGRAATAQLEPAGRRRRDGERVVRPDPGSSDHGVPARAPDGREHHAAGRRAGPTNGSDQLVGDRREPRAQGRAQRGGQGVVAMRGGHREVGGERVEPVAQRREVTELDHLGVLGR